MGSTINESGSPPPSTRPSTPGETPPTLYRYALSSYTSYAIVAICLGLIALGIIWRLVDLGYPNAFTFDEHHFVRNARNYIDHQADWNDHPPLGKLLLVPAMLAFGDNGFGWRLSSALLGIGLIALSGLIAVRLFQDRRIALFTAAFVAVDGMFLAYSRTALLDTPLTVFMYLALLLMLSGRSLYWFAAAAACVGLAAATKWTGVCIVLIAPWLLWRAKRSLFHLAWLGGVTVAVYVLVWVFALSITNQPISFDGIITAHVNLLKHHAGFTVWDNSASSHWYTWPFLTRPIVMHHEQVSPDSVRAMSCVGNVVVWFGTTVCVSSALTALVPAAIKAIRTHSWLERSERAQAFVLVTMVTLLLPFLVTERQSYIWHYMGAYGLGMSILSAYLVKLEKRSALGALAVVIAIATVAVYYAPVWTNATLTEDGYRQRLPFPGWR
jgi:dolichyl-phosphate-mannose--protein O-mannosyl transferase